MPEKVVDDLIDVIRNNTHLEEIHLNSNDLQSSASVISQALKAMSRNFKILNING